jgi:hypothetical protein
MITGGYSPYNTIGGVDISEQKNNSKAYILDGLYMAVVM